MLGSLLSAALTRYLVWGTTPRTANECFDRAEFMQWFKMHFDNVTNGQPIIDYDGSSRRAASKTGDIKGMGGGGKLSG
jgi:hypothetical protein